MLQKYNTAKLKKIIITIAKYVIYILVAYFIYSKLNGNISRVGSFNEISIKWIAISTLIIAIHTLFNSYIWSYMILSSGEKVSTIGQMEVFLKSFILRYIPGSVVGILSRGTYNVKYGIPMAKSLWGWFLENIFYLTIGILIGLSSILILDFPMWQSYTVLFGSIAIALFILFEGNLLEALFKKILLKKFSEEKVARFQLLKVTIKVKFTLLLLYFISWAIYSLGFIAILMAIGVDRDIFLAAVSINAMAWSIGYLSIITPSGAGVRESAMIFLFTTGVGLSAEKAVIITLLSRIAIIAGELVAFAIFYLYKVTISFTNKESAD